MTLTPTARGHLSLETDSLPLWQVIEARLGALGFTRSGPSVVGPDQTLFPSFTRDTLTLEAGWDIWSGYYLMASNDQGDAFLSTLAAALLSALPTEE